MIIEQGGHEMRKMSGRVLDVLETFDTLRIADVGFHQIDEARDRGSWRLDVVGDGKEQALTLVHDTLDFLVGSLQVFPVDAFLSSIAPDKQDHDNDGKEGNDAQQFHLPQQMLSCLHRFLDGFLHIVFLTLVYIAQMFGGAQGEFGAHHLQLFHLLADALLVVLCSHFLLLVYLVEDGRHVFRHVYWGGNGIDDSPVAVLFYAQGLGVLLLEGIGESAEESSSGLQYLYRCLFRLVGLRRLGVNQNGILSRIQILHLILQIVLGRFSCHGIRQFLQVSLLLLEQGRDGTVGSSPFLDILARSFIDGIDALGIAIHQTDCQNHDNGNGAISEGYLERNIVLVHEKSFKFDEQTDILLDRYLFAKLMQKNDIRKKKG